MIIEQIYKPALEEITTIEWTGDPDEYDCQLYELGQSNSRFLIVNPFLSDPLLVHYIEEFPDTDKCVVWTYGDEWVAKLFTEGWDPSVGYKSFALVKPKLSWNRNPDIDKLMQFEDDPFGNFEPEPWDKDYKLIWHIDPRFNPLPDKIWIVSCQPIGRPILGVKEMGYLTPDVSVEFNEHLPNLEIDIDECCPPFWELASECAYELDPVHQLGERLWVVKFTPNYRKPRGWKWLGTISPQFKIEYNPLLPKLNYKLDYVVPWHDLEFEHVWMLDRQHLQNNEDDIWAVKIKFIKEVVGTKIVDYITPTVYLEYNKDLPKLEYAIEYEIPWHDLGFEHVWMLDRKHLQNNEDDIWTVRARCLKKPKGTKTVGSVSPVVEVEYNPDLPTLEYTIDYVIPWHDLHYEHLWLLDRKHLQNNEDDIWAVKIKCISTPNGSKLVGHVSPTIRVDVNPDIQGYTFNIEYDIPYHDLGFDHVWILDKNYSDNFDIWAVKLTTGSSSREWKEMGTIEPSSRITYNANLVNLKVDIDYIIPYYDRKYIHVWYLDPKYTNGEKIWAAKMQASKKAKGEKEMGYVTPILPDRIDVVFISYHEQDAEKNWQRVLEKAPWAKRVDGVKGIFEAHKAAAKLATTDMFYVVDGDAYLVDEWTFDYQPGIFDRDCTYIWYSKNLINKLTYGYGGVKLFSREKLLEVNSWTTLDLSTTVTDRIKIIEKVSNFTHFNTDAFSTWRSVFRECVKLYVNNYNHPEAFEHQFRLDQWLEIKKEAEHASLVVGAVEKAIEFAKQHIDNKKELIKINDRDWLEAEFKKLKV
jgi:hypothetical protein